MFSKKVLSVVMCVGMGSNNRGRGRDTKMMMRSERSVNNNELESLVPTCASVVASHATFTTCAWSLCWRWLCGGKGSGNR